MSTLVSAFQLVLRRSLSNWKLLSSVIVGVVVAVALISSTPLYSNTLSDLGLARAVGEKAVELVDIHTYAPNYEITREDYERNTQYVDSLVRRNLGSVIRQEEVYIKSQTFYAGWADRPVPTRSPRPTGYFQVLSNLEDHVSLVDGRFPQPFPTDLEPAELEQPGLEIEAMLGPDAAEQYGVWVGDRIIILVGWGSFPVPITIRITGIIEPTDPTEEYWFLKTDVFFVPPQDGVGTSPQAPVAPLFIPEQTLFEGLGQLANQAKATYNWYHFVDTGAITSENAASVKSGVKRMQTQMLAELPRSSVFTVLDSVIVQFEQKLLYTQIPLFLLIFQIVAIVLYYVITVANMVVDRQAGEIALLRSRGASTWQLVGVYFMEGALIAAIGFAAGPFLGAGVFALLGKTGPFMPLTGGGLLETRFTGMVFALAAVAAVLCLIALLFPAIHAARVSVVHQRQHAARPPRAPFWQRYYLDIILLVIGGGLYYQLRQQGALVNRDLFGGVEMDPLLLVTPILFMLAAAIIFLRLFPLIIRLVSRLSRYAANASLVLSLRYMARNPVHYGRLILLLMMAASVGMFSASFLGTLQQSYEERNLYLAGGDVRLSGLYEYQASKETLNERYAEVPGIEAMSVASRGTGTMGSLFTQVDFSLLAVDPTNFDEVAWFREDFSRHTLPQLMDLLREDVPSKNGLPLPAGTERIGVWVYPIDPVPELLLTVRIRDGRGQYREYELGQPQLQDWQYLEVDLDDPLFGKPTEPVTIQTIYARLKAGTSFGRGRPTAIHLDDLQATGSFGPDPRILDRFEDVTGWVTIAEESAAGSAAGVPETRDTISVSTEIVHSGEASAKFTWAPSRSFGFRGIYPNLEITPMTAIVSQSLLDETGISVGDLVTIRVPGQYIPVDVKAAVTYFPTMDPTSRGFALVNLDRLTAIRNLGLGSKVYSYPNEIWLQVADDAEEREAALEALEGPRFRAREFYDQQAMIAESRADPLVAAGWGGILLIAFLGVILVSALGFVVYAYLSARGRQLEFAILRTLGFSLKQIIVLICLEQIFVIGSGMLIGTLLGMQLSDVMLPFLQLTEMGQRVLPPFVAVIDWQTIGIAYIILTVAFVATISLVVLYFSRTAIHKALRMGEA